MHLFTIQMYSGALFFQQKRPVSLLSRTIHRSNLSGKEHILQNFCTKNPNIFSNLVRKFLSKNKKKFKLEVGEKNNC